AQQPLAREAAAPTLPANDSRAAPPVVGVAPREPGGDDLVLPGLSQRVLVPGTRPGGSYFRRNLSLTSQFRQRGENVIEATEDALAPQSGPGRAAARVKRVLIGDRLTTAQQIHERLTKVKALAVLSSDAISSVAYGTEASLGILIAAGLGILHVNLGIGAIITLLMIIVGTSYWQTIHAYPHGGGSYIVARDNLGDWPGLIAAAALLIDYVLTVSVSVAAVVGALVSAVTPLASLAVPLGVFFILLIMVVNLRGIRESGTIFAAPTYLFVLSFFIMILAGVLHAATSSGGLFSAAPLPQHPISFYGWESQKFGILLVLTAFASGCAAMTGVEAISNGVPAFKSPEARNASRTLAVMIGILATLYLGTTYLAWRFSVIPYASQNPTLDSQIAHMLFVGPFAWMYFVVQFATLLILVLAANTSFADFPRLSSILARDGFLPHQFAFRGDRLAFTTGISVLALLSIILLVVFNGNTDALINLYALGVFTAFTLSQSGMVIRWLRRRAAAGPAWRRSLVINLIGAIATGIVALVIMVSKFGRGAWIVVLLVPLLVFMFKGISRHYATVHQQTETLTPLAAEEVRHIMLVPIAELNRPALQSLAYARSLTPRVIAIHVSLDDDEEARFRADWERWVEGRQERLASIVANDTTLANAGAQGSAPRERAAALLKKAPRLVVIQSPYRSLVAPLKAYIDTLRDANASATVSVILPEFVPAHWWERILHNQTALRLKLALYADPGVVVVNVPHHLLGATHHADAS
ncbi:MAG: APC family permease, partial [Ktedonobacterales bacterium]